MIENFFIFKNLLEKLYIHFYYWKKNIRFAASRSQTSEQLAITM
jgi:hypothetical protein